MFVCEDYLIYVLCVFCLCFLKDKDVVYKERDVFFKEIELFFKEKEVFKVENMLMVKLVESLRRVLKEKDRYVSIFYFYFCIFMINCFIILYLKFY